MGNRQHYYIRPLNIVNQDVGKPGHHQTPKTTRKALPRGWVLLDELCRVQHSNEKFSDKSLVALIISNLSSMQFDIRFEMKANRHSSRTLYDHVLDRYEFHFAAFNLFCSPVTLRNPADL